MPAAALGAGAAIPADAFLESVGVNTHLDSASYATDPAALLAALRDLGIRHLRDELRPGNDWRAWRALAQQAGVRFDLLVSPSTNTQEQMLAAIAALDPANVAAIEGQNEGDSPWFRAQPAAGADWAQAVIGFQRATAAALRAAYPAIPLISPSVLDYRPDDMARLRPIAGDCSIVALHAYAQRRQEPESADAFAGLAWYRRLVADTFKPGAPIMVTECGYPTDVRGLPPEIVGRYLPRLLLFNYAAGIRRTYLYELLDEGRNRTDPEQNWGLLGPALAPKPAFETLRLLLGALSDPGPAWSPPPGPLGLASPAADLRSLLFARRDGTLILALWRAARSWNVSRRRPIRVAPAPVQLRSPRRPVARLLLSPAQTWQPMTPPLLIDDTVTLVRLA